MAAVLAGARIGEGVGTRVGQCQRVVQLAIGEQPGIGRDRGAAKLQIRRRSKSSLSVPDPLHPPGPPFAAPKMSRVPPLFETTYDNLHKIKLGAIRVFAGLG